MASTSASMEIDVEQPHEIDGHFIRVIVADTQAIFRAGLRKIFALEDDIRVVGQSETLSQTLSAAKKFTADILIFEVRIGPESRGCGFGPDTANSKSPHRGRHSGVEPGTYTRTASSRCTRNCFSRCRA